MNSISGGIFADGISAFVAGLLGTYGLTVSTANVGLVAATGVASRRIAFVVGALLALAAFQPTMVGILTIMPPPVMAAALMFTAVFIMIGGVQIIVTRVLDARRTLVIGLGMMAFFAESVFPNAFKNVPHWAEAFVSTPLVLATIVALGLNLVFRLGIRRTVEMTIDPQTMVLQEVVNFIELVAGAWGARRDVINRVEFAAQHAVDAVLSSVLSFQGTPPAFSVKRDLLDANMGSDPTPIDSPRRIGFTMRHRQRAFRCAISPYEEGSKFKNPSLPRSSEGSTRRGSPPSRAST